MGTMATRKILITRGAGFVGSNLCDALLGDGHNVTVYDSPARPGTETNFSWLRTRRGSRLRFIGSDVRDTDAVNFAVRDVAAILSQPSQEVLRCASW
jgi:nucleoside-diphosphate-sugar epimerase